MQDEKLDIEKELADTADNMAQAEAELRKAQLAEPKTREAVMEAHDKRERLAEHERNVREKVEQALAEDPAGEIPPELAAELALLAPRPGGPGEPETMPGPRWEALKSQESRAAMRQNSAKSRIEHAQRNLDHKQYLHRWAKLKAAACELPELSRESITWTKTAEGQQALDGQVQIYIHAIGGNGVTHRVAMVDLAGQRWIDARKVQHDLADEPAYPGARAAQIALVEYLQELAREENWPVRLPPDAQGETVLRRHREKGQPAPFVRDVMDPDAKDPVSAKTAPKRIV